MVIVLDEAVVEVSLVLEDGKLDEGSVDDVTVVWSEGSSFQDFEGGFYPWVPHLLPFAGDFFRVRTAIDNSLVVRLFFFRAISGIFVITVFLVIIAAITPVR